MWDKESVTTVVKDLDPGALRKHPLEVGELASTLHSDESIENLVHGFCALRGKTYAGILVLTERRLVFLSKRLWGDVTIEEFRLDRITSVSYKQVGFLDDYGGSVSVEFMGGSLEVTRVQKARARQFGERLQARLAGSSTSLM